MINTEFNNQTRFRLPRKKISSILNFAQKQTKHQGKASVSVAFINPAVIKKWNKAYRRKNQVTDVLSFVEEQTKAGPRFLGEILICPQQAKKQAGDYDNTFEQEVLKLALHGFLHLLGYEHHQEKVAKKMEALEVKILNQFYDKS